MIFRAHQTARYFERSRHINSILTTDNVTRARVWKRNQSQCNLLLSYPNLAENQVLRNIYFLHECAQARQTKFRFSSSMSGAKEQDFLWLPNHLKFMSKYIQNSKWASFYSVASSQNGNTRRVSLRYGVVCTILLWIVMRIEFFIYVPVLPSLLNCISPCRISRNIWEEKQKTNYM